MFLDVLDDEVRIPLEDVTIATARTLADHVDLTLVARFEVHRGIRHDVIRAGDRLFVHHRDDVELQCIRLILDDVEDIDPFDFTERVGRARVAAENTVGGRMQRTALTGHETPGRGFAHGHHLFVAHAAAELSEPDSIFRELLRNEAHVG